MTLAEFGEMKEILMEVRKTVRSLRQISFPAEFFEPIDGLVSEMSSSFINCVFRHAYLATIQFVSQNSSSKKAPTTKTPSPVSFSLSSKSNSLKTDSNSLKIEPMSLTRTNTPISLLQNVSSTKNIDAENENEGEIDLNANFVKILQTISDMFENVEFDSEVKQHQNIYIYIYFLFIYLFIYLFI